MRGGGRIFEYVVGNQVYGSWELRIKTEESTIGNYVSAPPPPPPPSPFLSFPYFFPSRLISSG